MLLVPLTVRQIHSMQRMQQFAPQMKEIQKKYKGDRQRQNEELMKFYREHNINPAASCLPLAAQIPVFIGLYYTLRTFSKHPPPGNLSWLHFVPDISKHVTSHWSGYVLLTVYVLSQLASAYFMSASMQQPQSQKVLLYILPFGILPFIARFPTGLVLYWVTTNLWTVGQGLVTRRLIPKTPPPPSAPRRSSRTPPKEEGPPEEEASEQRPTDGAKPESEPNAAAGPPRRVRRKKKGNARQRASAPAR